LPEGKKHPCSHTMLPENEGAVNARQRLLHKSIADLHTRLFHQLRRLQVLLKPKEFASLCQSLVATQDQIISETADTAVTHQGLLYHKVSYVS